MKEKGRIIMKEPITITSERYERIFIHAVDGHFVTGNKHINTYVGTSDIKHNHEISVDTAMLMASYYKERDIEVDTVLCLYETQALGAYLAHEFARPTMMTPDPKSTVYVLGPEYDVMGNMIFRDNLKRMIENKKVVLLISCITSGKTIERAIESVNFYNGEVVGVSAVFSAIDKIVDISVNSIFTPNELPAYNIYDKNDCPLCKAGKPIDAIANGYGYSKL